MAQTGKRIIAKVQGAESQITTFCTKKGDNMAVSKNQAVFHSDIENVWNIVTSLENYKWRSDLSKIEIINEKQFIEYTKDGWGFGIHLWQKQQDPSFEYVPFHVITACRAGLTIFICFRAAFYNALSNILSEKQKSILHFSKCAVQ